MAQEWTRTPEESGSVMHIPKSVSFDADTLAYLQGCSSRLKRPFSSVVLEHIEIARKTFAEQWPEPSATRTIAPVSPRIENPPAAFDPSRFFSVDRSKA